MNECNAVALDLETLGTMPGNSILSIGLVAFNTNTGRMGDTLFMSFDPDEWESLGYTALQSTVDWWADSDRDPARPFLQQGRVEVGVGLAAVVDWLAKHDLSSGLWSRGYMDETMLRFAINGVLGIEDPWHYRAPSDARTLLSTLGGVFGFDYDIDFIGVPHHALDDAIHEAKLVVRAHRFMMDLEARPDSKKSLRDEISTEALALEVAQLNLGILKQAVDFASQSIITEVSEVYKTFENLVYSKDQEA